ncbi:MAG: hypothetical protein LQ339_004645 [Xanthoria mediterranea]|nr:MAG: hypothetical protein LQ339_004645 [Xanthoria mediterranea]
MTEASTMSGASSKTTFDLHVETPPHRAPPRPEGESYEELAITFNKTIEGHYRHGTTGYKRVGVLFLSWEQDDMQCKETEIDALRELFDKEFNYETAYFLIPQDRWQTALQKRIADLVYKYDSPDCLTIIYYGGHGKFEADESGDPTLFMNDILGCCRLPACDQLLIVDCCSAANAFGPEHVGKRKFEMIVSSGCKGEAARVPAPLQDGSFTKSLHQVLRKLLQENKTGFATSQLYRALFHSIQHKTKPWHFDQARRDFGRIWLRPMSKVTEKPLPENECAYLNLTLKLNKEPNSIAMNQLALQLQYLPHVDLVRFEKLYAPKRQIEDFMYYVRLAAKLRPLIRKVHAKRRLKKLMAQNEKVSKRPLSLIAMYLDQDQRHVSSACDWSSALDDHNPSPTSPLTSPASANRRKKSFTWPPVEPPPPGKGTTLSNRFFSLDYRFNLPRTPSIPGVFHPRRVRTMGSVPAGPTDPSSILGFLRFRDTKLALTNAQSISEDNEQWFSWRSDALWESLMWLAICYTLACFCYYMKE